MSTAYAFNVGLGLNFSGQEDEQNNDVDMSGYPQEGNHFNYNPGLSKSTMYLIIEYNSPASLSSPHHGQFFVPRVSRSEGNPVCPQFRVI